jgi:hypothetical protein
VVRRRSRRNRKLRGSRRQLIRLARAWLRARRKPLLQGFALALCVLVTINGLVRGLGGGSPNLLSPLHLVDKTRALGGLALHGFSHVIGDPHGDPRAIVSAAAQRNGVPVGLALAVAHVESGLHPHAISHTGAMGLMQLMPDTAVMLGVGDAFDSEANADGATRYLHDLLHRYRGDMHRAVAAYNAGPGRVPAGTPVTLPAETQHYVRVVLGSQPVW